MSSRAVHALIPSALLALAVVAACKSDAGTGPGVVPIVPIVAALKVGDLLSVNVNGNEPCSNGIFHPSRVVAIGTRSVILADTLNPTGGFSTADYERFAARFDTLVYPLDVANFGEPTDIDKNGRIIIVFTRAVNELTPPRSSQFVGGFAFSRDLFPKVGTDRAQACATSNQGEYFYSLAPDPTGAINANVRTRGFVDSVTTAVLVHELKHIINASRRLYVNNAVAFEVKWLDEGLAHIAEELLFYRESGLAPRSNLDITAIRASTARRLAFNSDMAGNAGRYRLFLQAPSQSSPYKTDDSLSTRGAAWSLLRYSADRLNATDGFGAGQAQTVAGSGDLTLSPGATAGEYSLTLTNTAAVSNVVTSFTLRGIGLVQPSAIALPVNGPTLARAALQDNAGALRLDRDWELRLRDRERRELTPRMGAARAWFAAQGLRAPAASLNRSASLDASDVSDAAVWMRLVNSRDTGFVNLQAVLGNNLSAYVRDWNVSHAVDDIAQPGTNFQQRSWNWRSIYAALGAGGNAYPLLVSTLSNDSTASGSVVSGGAAYYRIAVPANGTATLTLGASGTVNVNLQLVAVRTK